MSVYFPPYYYARVPADPGMIADLAKAINGEFSAIHCYEQIARLAPNAESRNRILEIRNDEIRHFQIFSRIYTALTGHQHTPKQTETCKTVYREGLDAAFLDEQETVDFYNSAADKAADAAVREAFRRAALDEQNHAVWFLYFLTAVR